jgi:hypothetical protein
MPPQVKQHGLVVDDRRDGADHAQPDPRQVPLELISRNIYGRSSLEKDQLQVCKYWILWLFKPSNLTDKCLRVVAG